jgi:hypothetical protein
MTEQQIEPVRPRLRVYDIGPGVRGVVGPVERVYAAIDVSRRRGNLIKVESTMPGDTPGTVVATVRFLPRREVAVRPIPAPAPRPSPPPIRKVGIGMTRVAIVLGLVVAALVALWLAVSTVAEFVASHNDVIIGGGVIIAGVVVWLLSRRDCEIHVTHIRR